MGIIISIILVYRKIKANNNNNYLEPQPAVDTPEQPALDVQTPSYPLVEKNNCYPTSDLLD